ncbi:MAG: c-type cytochrome [Verrucomicrobiae bacterium]|nr:c-type cytochrome [Verrucomicrobiae bacterium]NNJ44322.1 c-type cytochrome [Akkermansiaceae bacterium]
MIFSTSARLAALLSMLAATTSLTFAEVPAELTSTRFSGKDITPSPACLCAAPNGNVFVGIDLNGSLGKGASNGRIMQLADTNNDGTADQSSVFAEIDNPRGLIAVGNKLYVLHTVIPKNTGVISGMHLSLLTDANHDGKADGPAKPLVKNISTLLPNQKRGADHTTNGIRMGIDGWIYIAVGDFGFVGAKGTDGTELTQLGGGILRVRPDGSEMEVYTHGLRNIYDVAIDPFMNIFTRGNTNDGGGWNIRFIHHIQSGEYGYPTLFKNFTDEIIPALVDLGGGSGTGALFFQEPGWPSAYNNVPLMGDWGRSQLFIHRITPDGASFTQQQENFIGISQFTDVDVDGSGRMYIAAWDGAGYRGNPAKGYINRIVPKNWKYTPFPKLKDTSNEDLVNGLTSQSATTRLHTQQEILTRSRQLGPAILAIAQNPVHSKESRVAAIFTYAQLLGVNAISSLTDLAKDPTVREFALRALADRKPICTQIPTAPFIAGLQDSDPRVQVAAAVGLGRIGKMKTADQLLAVANPPQAMKASTQKDHQGGPHATPHAAVILPHVAVQSLVKLHATALCLAALDGPSQDGALWALRLMHDADAVRGLIAKLHQTTDPSLKKKLYTALARLYQKEAAYHGSWWWGTRPDTRGPYYKPVKWSESDKIEKVFRSEWTNTDASTQAILASIATHHRMNLPGIGQSESSQKPKKPKNHGQIGKTSIEDVMLSLDKIKANKRSGKKVLAKLACVACHNINPTDPIKGPDFNKIGSRLTKEQIAEAILKPAATISDSWVTVTLHNGNSHQGTLVSQTPSQVVINNIAGISTRLKPSDVKNITRQSSTIMGPGLANDLSLKQFADLVEYLHALK